MKRFLLIIAILSNVAHAHAKAHLLLTAPRTNFVAGSPVIMDVYLYNDGSNAIRLASLQSIRTEWSVQDPAGKRLPSAGVSATFDSHGTPNIQVAAGAVLHRRLKIRVDAKTGDLVTVKTTLGKKPIIESNEVVLFCGKR